MTITITYDNLYATVARSLSIIGKRSTDDQGNLLFKDITLGSREQSIVNDFFADAFVDICTALRKFVTIELQGSSAFQQTVYISYWTTENPSVFAGQVKADGEVLYQYANHDLYTASLSFPFSTITPDSGDLFFYAGSYYEWDGSLTQLTDEQVALLTDEQKAAAIRLSYYGSNPDSLTVAQADLYAYYNGSIYKSERLCYFTVTAPSASTLYYDPNDKPYQWQYGTMQRLPEGTADTYSMTVTLPDNWNSALQLSLRQALYSYCVAYALYSWFVITAPRIAEKYLADSQRLMTSVIRLVHEKLPPKGPEASPLDIATSITNS